VEGAAEDLGPRGDGEDGHADQLGPLEEAEAVASRDVGAGVVMALDEGAGTDLIERSHLVAAGIEGAVGQVAPAQTSFPPANAWCQRWREL